MHDNVGERDLFYAFPFAFNDHNVVLPDRLRVGDLNSGE